jgi:beta-lactamase regulating signal transducer with metallopeptidase domain
MTITNWLSPEVVRPAGWALLHFLWQGTALAGLAAVVMALIRRASARYIAAVSILIAMLAAPVATFLYYREAGTVITSTLPTPLIAVAPLKHGNTSAPSSLLPTHVAPDLFPWIVQAWMGGVVFFSLRGIGGLALLERVRRRESIAVTGRLRELCVDLQARFDVERVIRYCQCAWLEGPAVIGWFRPVVFLPVAALTGLTESQLGAVIAHELAHIKRFDSFVNGFQVVIETLLFYHPGVWWLNRRIRAERENCCDDAAIVLCGDAVEYARALTLMEEWRVAPAMAMAANRGPLSDRIMRLLGADNLRSGLRGAGFAACALCLSIALIVVNVIFGVTEQVSAQATPVVVPAPAVPAANPQTSTKAAPSVKPSPARAAVLGEAPAPAGSYIEAMKSAGLANLSVDDLIALKVQGVTPEYVQTMKELGIRPDREVLIGMKVQGIDANYVHAMQQEGIRADADNLIGMKVQGVTPEYVRGLKDLGFQPDADGLVGMKVQGVTPQYVRDLRALGFKPTVDEVIGMKVQGVTADYIKALQSAGFNLSIDDVIGAKVQGITPEFIERARKHGFQNLTLDKLIQLKQLGVLDKGAEI